MNSNGIIGYELCIFKGYILQHLSIINPTVFINSALTCKQNKKENTKQVNLRYVMLMASIFFVTGQNKKSF